MDALQIRTVRPEDLDQVYQVESQGFPPAEAAPKETLRARIKTYPQSFLVGVCGGKVIGIVNGCVTDQRTITDGLFENEEAHHPHGAYQAVFGLAVLPEFQGKGVGAALLREFCERARLAGRRGVILTCKERLIAYYATLGFHNLGVSGSVHGGAVWYDMTLEFSSELDI